MPLTAFQKDVARILAANRNPESHVAGGTVINRDDASHGMRFLDALGGAKPRERAPQIVIGPHTGGAKQIDALGR